jgi:hypothetical protein
MAWKRRGKGKDFGSEGGPFRLPLKPKKVACGGGESTKRHLRSTTTVCVHRHDEEAEAKVT